MNLRNNWIIDMVIKIHGEIHAQAEWSHHAIFFMELIQHVT